MKIEYSPKFRRLYKKLPQAVKALTEEKEKIFRKDPADKKLRTHKLGGSLRGYWAFWIDRRHRIIFSFRKSGTVRFHTVGTHQIYK